MKKVCYAIAFIILLCPFTYAEETIDGYQATDVEILTFVGVDEPATADENNARMYYNPGDEKLYYSLSGSAYVEVGSGSGISVPIDISGDTTVTGTLRHENGGLEADVSAYNGILTISGGSTSAIGVAAVTNGAATLATGDQIYDFCETTQAYYNSGDAATFSTVNTGQGAYELYAMNQDVESTDAVTFTTINTGQGAYELYAMNQNVLTTSDVTFNTVNGMTDAEMSQVENIGATTISATQWGYLGGFDQDLQTNDAVTFGSLTTTGAIAAGSVEISGSGESVLTMEDAAATSYDLTFTGTSWYADGVEIGSGGGLANATDTAGGVFISGNLTGNNIWTDNSYENIYIGSTSGDRDSTGAQKNVVIGTNCHDSNDGDYNVVLGYDAMTSVKALYPSSDNIAIGYRAMWASGAGAEAHGNIAIGTDVLVDSQGRTGDVGIGYKALPGSSGANTVIGYKSGYTSGNSSSANVFVGYRAGYASTSGTNTLIGYEAGDSVSTGTDNTFLGYKSGDNVTSGSNNIMIGQDVDAASATGSNQLDIGGAIKGNLAIGNVEITHDLTVGNVLFIESDNNVIDFTDDNTAQFLILATDGDSTIAMDLTVDGSSGSLSTAPMKIGTDLTTDGTNLYWKGEKLNT